jgi:hypothetical protein
MKAKHPMTTREMILFGAVAVLASTTLSLFFTTLKPWHGPGPRPMHAFVPGGPQGPQQPHHKKGGPSFGERMMLRADTDKDGFLTREEMLEDNRRFVEKLFTEADLDQDGKLSPDEMKKGREALRNKMRSAAKALVVPADPAAQVIQPGPAANQ